MLTVDPDATRVATYGKTKQGSTFSYNYAGTCLHPIVGLFAETGEVPAIRGRAGNAKPGRALGSVSDECIGAIPAARRGDYQLWVRVDSAGSTPSSPTSTQPTAPPWPSNPTIAPVVGSPEDTIRSLKETFGFDHAPLGAFFGNWLWQQAAAPAHNVTVWLRRLALPEPFARIRAKRLRLTLLNVAARVGTHARRLQLRFAAGYRWAQTVAAAIDRLHALPAFT